MKALDEMLTNTDMPPEDWDMFKDTVEHFTAMMACLLKANSTMAPNFLTFALHDTEGESYELTIRRQGGKTPAERIRELESGGWLRRIGRALMGRS